MNPLGILATLVTISLVPPCESDRQPALICPLVCSEEISKLRTSGMLSPLDHFLLQRVIEHLRVGNTLEARKCMEKMDSTKFEKDILLVLIAKCQAHRADQALQTIDSIRSASRKAQAILEVATVQLKCGNRKAAVALVDAIKLTSCSDVKRLMDNRGFDLQKPETWGIQYELDGITLFAVQDSEEKASAVAVAALRFTWALQGRRRNGRDRSPTHTASAHSTPSNT
jgi:hypothetical protein